MEKFLMNINLIFAIGLISIAIFIFTLIVGVVRLAIFFLSKKKSVNKYFILANVCLLFSATLVALLIFELLHASPGSVSGLMIPLFMPVPGIFCIFYVILSVISVRQKSVSVDK